jgi:hypothetical protein
MNEVRANKASTASYKQPHSLIDLILSYS